MAGILGMLNPQIGSNPIYQGFDQHRNAITGLLLGGLGNGSPMADMRGAASGFMAGNQADTAYQTELKKQQQVKDQLNQTLGWLKTNAPDYYAPVAAGVISPADAYSAFQKARAAGSSAEAGLQPVWLKDPNKQTVFAQTLKGGGLLVNGKKLPGIPDGFTPMFPVQQLNAGTGFVETNKYGGQTGNVTPIDNTGKAFDAGIGADLAKNVSDARKKAQDAVQSLRATQEATTLLDSGVITGFGADWKLGFGKALQQVGVNISPDAIANTEAFAATRAQEVGRIIKLFGAGTGLSDADREFATKAAAGQITMNETSIRRILDINARASQFIIDSYNQMIQPIDAGNRPSLAVGAQPQAPSPPPQGEMTATNPQTGQKIVLRNGQWVPMQ